MKYLRYNQKNDTVRIELTQLDVKLLKTLLQGELRRKVDSCDNSFSSCLFDMLGVIKSCEDVIDLPF